MMKCRVECRCMCQGPKPECYEVDFFTPSTTLPQIPGTVKNISIYILDFLPVWSRAGNLCLISVQRTHLLSTFSDNNCYAYCQTEPMEKELPLYQIYDEDHRLRQLVESVSDAPRKKLIKRIFAQEGVFPTTDWTNEDSGEGSDSDAARGGITDRAGPEPEPENCCGDDIGYGLNQLIIGGKHGTEQRQGRGKLFPMWSEQDKILKSGLLEKMDKGKIKLQEASYEVISSEQSYLITLNLVVSHFTESPLLQEALQHRERHILFSNIVKIRDASKRFLDELLAYQGSSLTLEGVLNILLDHLPHFDCYISYCANNQHQLSLFRVILETRPHIMNVIRDLEKHPDCQKLDLMSFLMLPFQRITRLPLLLKAILEHSQLEDKENANQAFEAFTKLAKKCNDEAERLMQIKNIQELLTSLTFKEGVKYLELSQSAIVKKKGTITLLTQDVTRLGRKKLVTKSRVLVITSEKVIIAKERVNGDQTCREVQDWCLTNRVSTEEISKSERKERFRNELLSEAQCAFVMTFLVNSQKTEQDYIICTQTESDKERWIQALGAVSMRMSACLDCPRVFCIKSYVPEDIDEIRLDTMDQLDVLKKMEDGWWEGRKLQDGSVGWFPASHVREMEVDHTEMHKKTEKKSSEFKKRLSFQETNNAVSRRRNRALYRRRSANTS